MPTTGPFRLVSPHLDASVAAFLLGLSLVGAQTATCESVGAAAITPTLIDTSCCERIILTDCVDPTKCTNCCTKSSVPINLDRTAYQVGSWAIYIDPSSALWTMQYPGPCTSQASTKGNSTGAAVCPTGLSWTSWSFDESWTNYVGRRISFECATPPAAPASPPTDFKVETSFTLSGSVGDYDDAAQASIKKLLANGAGVLSSAVALSIVPASVLVSATIYVTSQAEVEAKSSALFSSTGLLRDASTLEAALKGQFQADGVSTANLKVEVLTPPATGGEPVNVGLLVGVIVPVAVVVLLAVVVVVVVVKKKNRKGRIQTSA